MPRISVILPVFNGQQYIHTCISSVLEQSLDDFELLIADDSSTDQTRQVILGFKDPRIRTFWRRSTSGLFGNLNYLLAYARAPLVRFLCQDDYMEPCCLESEVQFFSAHPDIGMSYCKARLVDEVGREVGRTPIDDLPTVIEPSLSLQLFYYLGCLPGNLSMVCARRACFERVGSFDDSFQVSGDYEMWVRICEQANLGIVHQYLIGLRQHANQLSKAHSSMVSSIAENRRILANLRPQLPPEIQTWARWYFLLRQNVFDTHYAVRCILSGLLKDFVSILQTMGLGDFGLGVLFWLLTMNNHLFRPSPKLVGDSGVDQILKNVVEMGSA